MADGVEESEEFIFLDSSEDAIEVKRRGVAEVAKKAAEKLRTRLSIVKEQHSESDSSKEEAPSVIEYSTEISPPTRLATGSFEYEWNLNGMDCPDCAMKAMAVVNKIEGVSHSNIRVSDGAIVVQIDLDVSELATANKVLSSLGHDPDVPWYKVSGTSLQVLEDRHRADKRSLRRLLLSAPGVLDIRFESGEVLLQTPDRSSPEARLEHKEALERMIGGELRLIESKSSKLTSENKRLIGASIALFALPLIIALEVMGAPYLAIATIGAFGTAAGGLRMFVEAFASIRNRVLGFQILTSLAVAGAIILQHWPEALMVVVLESISGHLEISALVRAREAMQGGLDRLPRTARVVQQPKTNPTNISVTTSTTGLLSSSSMDPGPQISETPIDLVRVGQLVEVRSGELIPIDGIVREGVGQIDRAPLTGESTPIRVEVGDTIEAGLVLLRGPLVVETLAVGEDTRLSGLIERVHTFRDKPPRMQSAVETFTQAWVPIVIIGGAAVALLTGDIVMMLLLWVVACPCALLLAAPVPHANALANAAHHGIIARGGDVLERAARVDLALLDKTGTLTSGKPRLDAVVLAKGVKLTDALTLAGGLEVRSNHPYAATILSVIEEEGIQPDEIKSIKDELAGVSGKRGRTLVRFGRDDWLADEGVSIPRALQRSAREAKAEGLGVAMLSQGKDALALFTFDNDDLRLGADTLINDLSDMGVAVELLSGDSQPAVVSLGKRLGISESLCRGEIDPDGKAIWVNRRSLARCTLMAGDGFNDAAALASADVGIAVGSGESVNLEAADVLIPSENPRIISRFLKLSRKTRLIVKANLAISLVVTFLLVISVILRWHSSLALGVFIHEASALLVILNGIWLSDVGMSRMGVMGDLFRQLFQDTKAAWQEAWSLLATTRAERNLL